MDPRVRVLELLSLLVLVHAASGGRSLDDAARALYSPIVQTDSAKLSNDIHSATSDIVNHITKHFSGKRQAATSSPCTLPGVLVVKGEVACPGAPKPQQCSVSMTRGQMATVPCPSSSLQRAAPAFMNPMVSQPSPNVYMYPPTAPAPNEFILVIPPTPGPTTAQPTVAPTRYPTRYISLFLL